jgi:hypothetical protein
VKTIKISLQELTATSTAGSFGRITVSISHTTVRLHCSLHNRQLRQSKVSTARTMLDHWFTSEIAASTLYAKAAGQRKRNKPHDQDATCKQRSVTHDSRHNREQIKQKHNHTSITCGAAASFHCTKYAHEHTCHKRNL